MIRKRIPVINCRPRATPIPLAGENILVGSGRGRDGVLLLFEFSKMLLGSGRLNFIGCWGRTGRLGRNSFSRCTLGGTNWGWGGALEMVEICDWGRNVILCLLCGVVSCVDICSGVFTMMAEFKFVPPGISCKAVA
uniref:Uncharacterized protein n=1 Tax=Glossina brevipalpis TaxID=37001 RepID=A0A1A9X3A8_9MUSC